MKRKNAFSYACIVLALSLLMTGGATAQNDADCGDPSVVVERSITPREALLQDYVYVSLAVTPKKSGIWGMVIIEYIPGGIGEVKWGSMPPSAWNPATREAKWLIFDSNGIKPQALTYTLNASGGEGTYHFSGSWLIAVNETIETCRIIGDDTVTVKEAEEIELGEEQNITTKEPGEAYPVNITGNESDIVIEGIDKSLYIIQKRGDKLYIIFPEPDTYVFTIRLKEKKEGIRAENNRMDEYGIPLIILSSILIACIIYSTYRKQQKPPPQKEKKKESDEDDEFLWAD